MKFLNTCALAIPILLHGCASPLANQEGSLYSTIGSAENMVELLSQIDKDTHVNLPILEPTIVETTLDNRREELEDITPANDSSGWTSRIGTNLHMEDAVSTPLTLNDAVMYAVKNNLDLKIASLQPAIAKHAVVAAEAAFDFVLGAGASNQRSRIPQQQLVRFGGIPLSSSESSTDTFSTNASLTRLLRGGGTVSLSTDLTKTSREAQGFSYSPDPAWQSIGRVDLTQPLLRNFGKTVTLSQIHLSEIVRGRALEDFKQSLNTIVTATEHSYLDLELHWKTLQVKQWLLEQGEQVVKILELRRDYDTGESDYAQAVATVQQRRVDVISQQALIQTTSDQLKTFINTDDYSPDSEVVIQPTGTISANAVSISLRQALLTAIQRRPDLRNLALAINSESINMQVADNARLPQLDFRAQMSLYGLGDSASTGYQEVYDADFINYLVGLTFQIPLGNRAAESQYQSSRLQKMVAIATYKRGVQQATVEVKAALRDIVTNAALMRANRSFRVAQAENLRALKVEEETMMGLTPTFLNLKLQTQNGLATARISEFRSIVNYNKAIASLYEAMGTTLDMRQISINQFGFSE